MGSLVFQEKKRLWLESLRLRILEAATGNTSYTGDASPWVGNSHLGVDDFSVSISGYGLSELTQR